MQLSNEFNIPVGIAEGWDILTDVKRIAPCMPGAYLTSTEEGRFLGGVKVKVGPITAAYSGVAEFVEMDSTNYRAVLRADAREDRGNGNARADITLTLTARGNTTDVTVVTDLAITGRLAQFGRGVITDISSRLIGQFASALEAEVASSRGASSKNAQAVSRRETVAVDQRDVVDTTLPTSLQDVAAGTWPDDEQSQPPVTRTQIHGDEPSLGGADMEAQPLDLLSSVVVPQLVRLAKPALGLLGAVTLAFVLGRLTAKRNP